MTDPGLAKQLEWVNQRVDRVNDHMRSFELRVNERVRPLERTGDRLEEGFKELKDTVKELTAIVTELKDDFQQREGSQRFITRLFTTYFPGIVALGSIVGLIVALTRLGGGG